MSAIGGRDAGPRARLATRIRQHCEWEKSPIADETATALLDAHVDYIAARWGTSAAEVTQQLSLADAEEIATGYLDRRETHP
ncbi:MAG: hypothetical protein ACR2F6_16205 [Mycobacteriales bacterium]